VSTLLDSKPSERTAVPRRERGLHVAPQALIALGVSMAIALIASLFAIASHLDRPADEWSSDAVQGKTTPDPSSSHRP
jgi:hypothetical protein